MDFWTQLEAVRSRHDVLQHPFYQRWSAGQLKQEELAYYAGEYHQAVCGLAEGVAATAAVASDASERKELEGHAREETSHIALWREFADAVGTSAEQIEADGRPESMECRAAWGAASDAGYLEGLVTLYAIESGQPVISETKLAGLKEFYGYQDGPATQYFALHAELDKEHAQHSRDLINKHLVEADVDKLLAAAERAFEANWKLLDGVDAHFGHSCESC